MFTFAKIIIMFYSVTFFDLVIIVMLLGLYFLLYSLIKAFADLRNQMAAVPVASGPSDEAIKLKLQAIERLIIFTERAGLKNMVERLMNQQISAAEMHRIFVDGLREEFDYNQSQQIYVSAEIWHAITRMKDQNIYIINHITANLSPQATSADLCKMILEYSLTPNAEMNQIVLEALNNEAKNNLK